MKRGGWFVATLWVVGAAVGVNATDVGPTDPAGIERSIQAAEELGNFSQVQALRVKLAEWDGDHGKYAEAAQQYELLLAARPSDSDRNKFNTRLGDMRNGLGDWGRAIAAYSDALHEDPKIWAASLGLARAYTQAELNSQALLQYQHCIQLRPNAPEPYAEIGAIYQKLSYLDKAIENYRASQKVKAQPRLYLQIADCYLREGDMDRASAELQLAKAKLPLAEYDVRLGDIERRRGQLEKAAAAWSEALRADPKRDDVRLKLALVDDELHHPAESDREMEKLLRGYPNSPLVHFLHAWILYRRGEVSAARSETKLVQTLQATDVVAHYNESLLKEINQ